MIGPLRKGNSFKKPEPELLEEIAEYFGVSVKELEE